MESEFEKFKMKLQKQIDNDNQHDAHENADKNINEKLPYR